MFDVDRILAIPDYEPDAIQMGLSTHNRGVLRARGYKRTDGIEAKDRFIKADKKLEAREKAVIKGDKPLAEKKSAYSLTKADYEKRVELGDPHAFSNTTEIDYGRLPRGQGRRSGGMVMGAMGSGGLQGKKTYVNTVGKLPDAERSEIALLERHAQVGYAKARSAGFSHDEAALTAYALDEGKSPHEWHVERALRTGQKVPSDVLKDYPDLAKQYSKSSKIAPDTAKKIKAAIANQRSKTPSTTTPKKSNKQKSDQASQLVEKTRKAYDQAVDKVSSLSDELSDLRSQAQDGKSKVATGRTKKRASEMTNAMKFNAALEAEAMNNGEAIPVMRKKANKNQMASLNDRINQKENEQAVAQSRVNQLKTRANKLYNASVDYGNKPDIATSATPKSRKVVKGISPRDRGKALEKLKEQKERIEDMISTKKSLNQDIPQAWLDKYSEVSSKLNPKKKTNSVKQGSEVYSLPVYGHPENHGYVKVGNKDVRTGFIPYKVDKNSDMTNMISHAEKLVSDLSSNHFSMDAIAQGRQKATVKQKKEAKSYMRSVTAQENLSMIKTLKDETIPELYRLDKEVKKLKKSKSS